MTPFEPPVGSVVLDKQDRAWQRTDDGEWVARWEARQCWQCLNRNHGPLWIIYVPRDTQ